MALPTSIHPQIDPLITRWNTFLQKFTERVEQIAAEADAGLNQLIQEHTLDTGPMGAALSAVQARFHNLGTKLSEAFENLEEKVDEVSEEEDFSEATEQAIADAMRQIRHQYENYEEEVELRYELLHTQKQAAWARALFKLAEKEQAEPVACSSCGAPFAASIRFRASNEACPHCRAVNTISVGLATGLFYQGNGVHALAHEGAFAEWKQERKQEKIYQMLSHPTSQDRDRYLAAARSYWTKYYQETKRVHPGFEQPLPEAIEGRMKFYTDKLYDPAIDQMSRKFIAQMIPLAVAGDRAGVQNLLNKAPPGVEIDECLEALVERNESKAAELLLDIKYDLEDLDEEDDPRRPWIAEQLADIRSTIANRR